MNMYAADRAQPIVPERHEDKSEDAELEALKAQKEKLDVKKGAAEEEVLAQRSDLVMKEFNSLADLIAPPSSSNDDFKLNLFSEYAMASDGS